MKRLHPLWHSVAATILLALASLGDAQAASYTYRSDSFTWESAANVIAWNRTCTGFPGDDDAATINFSGGFTFTFAGTAHGSVRVLSNGALQFGTDTGFFRNYTNTTLPAGAATARAGCVATATTLTMFAYWTDLNPSAAGSGGVTWEQKGTAPNRYVVVSWNAVYQYNTSTPYTFQIVLFENGEFKYQYGNANATGANATIGVQVGNTDYTLYSYNSGYNANGTAVRWVVPASAPSRVAEYRFDELSYSGTVGEVADSSGNGHGGVRVGAAASTASGYVCRGLEIPANTSTTSAAVDTLLDLDGGVGTVGSLTLWYRGNLVWTSSTPAMIADATSLSTRPFFLMRNNGGALRFTVSDSAGIVLTATTANQTFAAGTWVHLAATWRLGAGTNQSSLRLYVNGALAATALGTTNATLDPQLVSLFLGDNRGTATPSGATPNSANGRIDEVRVYNYEATPADIAFDMAATHSCLPPIDHYEVSLPSASLACLPSTVTVKACANTSSPCTSGATSVNGRTATLATSAGTLGATTLTFDANGVATTTLSHPGAGNGSAVSVTLSGEQNPAANARQCCPNGTACSVANVCSTTFNTAGFIVASAAGGAAATLPAQVAGTASGSYVLRAVRIGTTTQACEAALSGTTTVNWAYQCNNPSVCSAGNLLSVTGNSATAISANPNSGVTSYTAVPMTFDANGNAPFTFTFNDVGQATLWVSKVVNSATLSGSSNAFVTRPAGFTLSNIRQSAAPNLANPAATSSTGAAFVKAGESFGATVTAVTSAGAATPNYGKETAAEGALLTRTLVQPSAGAPGTLANGSIAGASFSNGAASVSNLSFSEVGIITLTPSVADADYLGAGNVSGSASANIGRFVPARFALGGASITHRSGQACAPTSSFTYLGENFSLGFTLSAQNLAGATTQNYSGSFAKLDLTSAAGFNLAGLSGTTAFSAGSGRLALGSATGSWSNGVAAAISVTANPARVATPDGPFAAAFGIAPTDSDGVALSPFDMPSTSGGANDRASVGTMNLRFGRLRLSNAVGSQARPLTLALTAQYWNGSYFDVNTLDSCTVLAATTVSFGNLRRTLSLADTALSGSSFALASGRGALTLAAPSGGRYGTVDVSLSLGSSATDASCLQPWTPGTGDAATTGANLSFLRGAWCGSSYANDPSARATFGLYRGADTVIYQRENY